jgi:hypothetical protein
MSLFGACTPVIDDSGDPDDSGSIDTADTADSADSADSGDTGAEDRDGDGWPASEDCNDLDPRVRPDASEVAWNNVDDNCDGIVDADGDYAGTVTLNFAATIEGRRYRWDIPCPTTLRRNGWQLDFRVACQPPEGDEVARRALGATMYIDEVDNVADQGAFSGETEVSSTDGWDTAGGGTATWATLDEVTLSVSMRATFASFGGTGTLRR